MVSIIFFFASVRFVPYIAIYVRSFLDLYDLPETYAFLKDNTKNSFIICTFFYH